MKHPHMSEPMLKKNILYILVAHVCLPDPSNYVLFKCGSGGRNSQTISAQASPNIAWEVCCVDYWCGVASTNT